MIKRLYVNNFRCLENFELLVVDFDGVDNRMEKVRKVIPDSLAHRVLVLGALNEPEDLQKTLGNWEEIEQQLAKDCREDTTIT